MKILMKFLVFIIIDRFSARVHGYDIIESIENFGYPVETHEVLTEDGYILGLHRIRHGRGSTSNRTNEYPVLINHGMMGSSECFVILGPEKSLGFVLADNGYDVWLENARGSWHSRKHKTLDPDKDRAYWQFSWHEIGVYDIPAIIDYILGVTQKRSLHYIGHSQGATAMFVMGSERPEYNAKVKVAVALAPSALFKNKKNPLLFLVAPLVDLLKALVEYLKLDEFPPPSLISAEQVRFWAVDLCAQSNSPMKLCKRLISVVISSDISLIDSEAIGNLVSIAIAGFSTKQLLHYIQLLKSGDFEKYDFGWDQNLQIYNSRKPPLYDFSKITSPTALIYSATDELVNEKDVKLLRGFLPNVVDFFKVPYKKFGHNNFIIANNIDIVLNKEVMRVMKDYND
ncbi:unnamed protein product [Phaedon cochleariae]|uniref:Lipase n=1 Tax=Phaedon cochleariae TaxID=80249 RepID=A0A9P0DSW0_PHACE|nr:unnamed protein product [Phaedon cochleariae]